MKRARLIMVALLVSGRAVCAQPVDLNKGLAVCLEAARAADDECAKLTDNPAGRIECFQKTRSAELECLDHALSVAPVAASGQAMPAVAAPAAASGQEMPAASAPAAGPGQVMPAASAPAAASGQETPAASAPAASPGQETPAAAALAAPPAQAPAAASPDVAPIAEPSKAEAAVGPPEPPTASISASAPQPGDQRGKDQDATPPPNPDPIQATTVSPPAAPAAASAEAAQPHEPDTATLRESSWVVSETTSPVDFSPLITAAIRPASRLGDGPSNLAVRCRRGRTELSIWSEASWHSPRNDAVLVDYRVNKEPIVRLMWSLSADAKTATYREDAVDLLRSLPEGALLSISLPDGDNPRREATFLLTGWTAIRQKIEKLCNWPPAGRLTYGKRETGAASMPRQPSSSAQARYGRR